LGLDIYRTSFSALSAGGGGGGGGLRRRAAARARHVGAPARGPPAAAWASARATGASLAPPPRYIGGTRNRAWATFFNLPENRVAPREWARLLVAVEARALRGAMRA